MARCSLLMGGPRSAAMLAPVDRAPPPRGGGPDASPRQRSKQTDESFEMSAGQLKIWGRGERKAPRRCGHFLPRTGVGRPRRTRLAMRSMVRPMRPYLAVGCGATTARRLTVRCFFANGTTNGRSVACSHGALIEGMKALKGDPLETTGSKVVTYRGNPNANHGDWRGPGSGGGPAGEALRRRRSVAGQHLGLRRVVEDVYITNIVKRPPNNRTPPSGRSGLQAWIEEISSSILPSCAGAGPRQTVLSGICSPGRLPISQIRQW